MSAIDAELIDRAMDHLGRVYGQMSLCQLFAQRRGAKSPAWFWAFNALIHRRRGQIDCARASWQHAMRLTLESVAGQSMAELRVSQKEAVA